MIANIAITLSVISLLFVVAIFILVLCSNKNDELRSKNKSDAEKEAMEGRSKVPNIVDLAADHAIDLEHPPMRMDGIVLNDGNTVYLQNQTDETENGVYMIEQDNTWRQIVAEEEVPEGHRLHIRQGIQGSQNSLLRGAEGQEMQFSRYVIQDKDIPLEARHLTILEIRRGVVITEADVLLPDPEEIGFSSPGEIRSLHVYNRHTSNSIELGFSSKWELRGPNALVNPTHGVQFVLRYVGGPDLEGEVYRSQ